MKKIPELKRIKVWEITRLCGCKEIERKLPSKDRIRHLITTYCNHCLHILT